MFTIFENIMSYNLTLHVCNFVLEFDHRLISMMKYFKLYHKMEEKLFKSAIIKGDEIRYKV